MKKITGAKLIIAILLILGIGFVSYPFICNTYNQYKNDRAANEYNSVVEGLSDKESDNLIEEAREYNQKHPVIVIADSFGKKTKKVSKGEYWKILDPLGDGSMGYIEIPKINIKLMIYHGTDEKVLEQGCGHVEGSSFPVGGINTHSILAAHRGLPTAKLFTDIDMLEKKDKFYIYVAREALAYEVDSIRVVKPEDLGSLNYERGDDRVTLLTCTPYGVNSHRLLVSGHRTAFEKDESSDNTIRYLIIAALIVMLLLALTIIIVRRRKIAVRR